MPRTAQLKIGFGLLACLMLTALTPRTAARTGEAAESAAAVDVLITEARLFDGVQARRHRFDVAITGGRIRAVAESSRHAFSPRTASRVVEAQGRWLLPGLIDVHQHLFVHLADTSDKALAEAINGEVGDTLRSYLRHGVTTIRSVGDFAPAIYTLRARLDAGSLTGPHLLVVGRVLSAPGGHPGATVCSGDPLCRSRLCFEIADRADAVAAVAAVAGRGADAVKVVVGHDHLPSLSTPILETIVEQAHRRDLRVTAHTTSLADARRAVEAGVDSLEHGVVEQEVDEAFARLLRRHGVTYAPTLFALKMQTALPPAWSRTGRRNFAFLLARGIPMATGADFPGQGLSVFAEMIAMVEAGANRRQALEAATAGAARHLGLEGELGVIAPGARADLILVDGDPLRGLQSLQTPVLVLLSGMIVETDSERKE